MWFLYFLISDLFWTPVILIALALALMSSADAENKCYSMQDMKNYGCLQLCQDDDNHSGYYDIKLKSCVCKEPRVPRGTIKILPAVVVETVGSLPERRPEPPPEPKPWWAD